MVLLKKVQSLWNALLRKKKSSTALNIYDICNTFNASNRIATSITFYIVTLKGLQNRSILLLKTSSRPLTAFSLFFIVSACLFLSFLFYLA